MIVLAVLYPNEPGNHFDMDYYCATHLPLVKKMVGDALKGMTCERGVSGGDEGSAADYAVITRLHFDSVEDFATHMAPHSPALNADIPNFTDITPRFQISEVVV